MMNLFNLNFEFPFGMNNWFMPNWSFPNYFSSFQMPIFNMNNMWFNSFNPLYNPSFTISSFYPNNFININSQNSTNPKSESVFTLGKSNKVEKSSNTDVLEKSDNKLKLEGYNASKGERLANIALNRSVGWTGYCARYVKNSIQNAGLGLYKYGHAYQMKDILKNNSNFKEISTENVDVKDLPAGCVLVYGKGKEGYSKNYGHTEITTGDGRAVSDGITKNLYKKPSAIFIPV